MQLPECLDDGLASRKGGTGVEGQGYEFASMAGGYIGENLTE